MSNKKCCVPGCAAGAVKKETLHKFPNPEVEKDRFDTWVYSISGELLSLKNDFIFKYRRVCHQHFEEKYWCRCNRISNIAVPTLHMPDIISRLGISYETRRPLSQIQNIEIPIRPSTSADSVRHTSSQSSSISCLLEENIMIEATKPDNTEENVKLRPKKLATRVARRVSQSEQALYKKLLQVRQKLSKCRSKKIRQTKEIKMLQNISTHPKFLHTLENFSSIAKILTLMQFREHKKKSKGRRFSIKEKIVALAIMKQSPKGYRFLRKFFILPAPQTLIKLMNMANIKPGINKNIIEQLKKKSDKMTPDERLCIILFDEMHLKANVAYNERKDKVVGFVTDGEQTQTEFADHAQVYMVRGLLKNYKQPVSYTFSQAATKGLELAKQLKTIIKSIQATGLKVVATVCDQGTNNVQCVKSLVNETREEFVRRGEEMKGNFFLINSEVIFPLFDPPHLIKCIRNNLITKDLKYVKEDRVTVAKWVHMEQLLKENPGYQGIRLIPKLTDSHVLPHKIPKMKVKFATQVFSRTVASNMGYLADKGILPPECKDTADILLFFDNLFDSVNGSYQKRSRHGKPLLGAATPSSTHHATWQEAKKMLKEMSFINKLTGVAERVPTISNWVWTIEGIQSLIKLLKEKYDVNSIWLRHLNQDPLENFFGAIRSQGCRNTNPSAEKFESSFSSLLINSLSNVHTQGANCETDNCYALHEIIVTNTDCKNPPNIECNFELPDIRITPLEDKNDPRQISGLIYVSGYFIKNVKKNVFKSCKQCNADLLTKDEYEYLKYREYAGKRWLCSPSIALLNAISNLQDVVSTILTANLEKNNLKELIKTFIFMFIEFDFIKCEEHKEKITDYLITISCRFFIHNYCKEINRVLTNKRECDDDHDILKVKAKRYFYKCYRRKQFTK